MALSKTRLNAPKDAMVEKARKRKASGEPRLWRECKGMFTPDVAAKVSAVLAAGGVTIHDVIALEMAALINIERQLAEDEMTDYLRQTLTSFCLQSRKHLSRILLAQGEGASLNDITVEVPLGLRVVPAADTGDELR